MQNLVSFVGNLTKDVSLRTNNEGKNYAILNVAASNINKGTNFYQAIVNAGLAETCNKYLCKGSQVFITGELYFTVFKGEDGKEYNYNNVRVSDIKFLNKLKTPIESKPANTPNARNDKAGMTPIGDDDMPF